MTHRRTTALLALAALTATAGHGPGGESAADSPLPKAAAEAVVRSEAAVILEALAAKKPNPKLVKRARSAAALLASAAQERLADPADARLAATTRDAGLRIIKLLEDDEIEAARKLATEVQAGLKPDPAADTNPVKLEDHADTEAAMLPFAPPGYGGQGLEVRLKELRTKATKTQLAEGERLAYKLAATARITRELPSGKVTASNGAAWDGLADELRVAALQAARAAADGDLAEFQKALGRADTACNRCHGKFK
jgi:hypothetical protein